jgi:hypothetical protein
MDHYWGHQKIDRKENNFALFMKLPPRFIHGHDYLLDEIVSVRSHDGLLRSFGIRHDK